MKIKLFLLLIFILAINYVYGKNVDKTKSIKIIHKNTKQKDNKARARRSLDEDIDKLFTSSKDVIQHGHIVEGRGRVIKLTPIVDKELPFWGARGRRDSSEETVPNEQLPSYNHHKQLENMNLDKSLLNYQNKLRRDEADSPFWGNRGRRDSGKSDENDINLFWANRGRRQDEEPFWGTRGRREELSPFWGNRGRRDDDEPFWGNRGRRQEQEPFWGNRGRRENSIIENIGEKNKVKTIYINDEPHNRYQDSLKINLKNSIIESIDDMKNKIENFSRNRRQEAPLPFWTNRGRDSKLRSLFNGKIRNRLHNILNDQIKGENYEMLSKFIEPNTVHDSRMYAEEPRYILVERSSRSSAEEDPFFISRGKKYSEYDLDSRSRGRRGSIEELVKSLRNDPYYIARGKKDAAFKTENSTNDLAKTKELVCSTVDFLTSKIQGSKVKRDINDSERNRRTILKKLALQLQMDPYFVSRGKKNDESSDKLNVEDFISKILVMCN